MPNCELLPKLKEIRPGLHVIVLSARPEVRQKALASGADIFVSKMDPPDRLLTALGMVTEVPGPEPTQEGGEGAGGRRLLVHAGVAAGRSQPVGDGMSAMTGEGAGALAPAVHDKRGG
jgi:hypothetical protein